MPMQENSIMTGITSEWHDYDPHDLSTHPEENKRVQMKYANGRQFTGRYSRAAGMHAHVGIVPEDTINLAKKWRYVEDASADS